MSQKKVDQYKHYKKNRERIQRREKIQERLEIGAFIVIMIGFVAWFGWSVYDKITAPDPNAVVQATEIDMNAYGNYVSGLQSGFTS